MMCVSDLNSFAYISNCIKKVIIFSHENGLSNILVMISQEASKANVFIPLALTSNVTALVLLR